MTKVKRNLLICVVAVICALLTAFSAIPHRTVISYAANTNINFDDTDVIDDLKNSVIDGKDYSLAENNFFADYNFDSKKETQLFSFVEYCYSFYENLQANYSLYVYVYNPKGLKFVADSALNKLTMRVGGDTSANYEKYSLLYLNRCEEKDYEGLFYKYKVILSTAERQRILETLNSTERIYSVSEFELQIQGGGAESFYVSTDYKVKGYAAGYGANAEAESTLSVTSEQCDTLSLDVHATAYRSDGTNGKDEYTQDSLHSVYFAVPNRYIREYGEMAAVHATWLNAVTNWGLVTGNKTAYDAINNNYINRGTYELSLNGDSFTMSFVSESDLNYSFVSGYYSRGPLGGQYYPSGHRAYNFYWQDFTNARTKHNAENDDCILARDFRVDSQINALHYVFWSGNGANSADTYSVSSEEMIAWLKDYTGKYGGSLVNEKYSKSLFEHVDEEFTEVKFTRDKSFSLTSQKLEQSFWEKYFFGGSHVAESTTYNGISAVHKVQDSDFISSPEVNSQNLYIALSDYNDFKTFYDKAISSENDSTVYLFRYMVSDYIAEECAEITGGHSASWAAETWREEACINNTNAYFFKETVNLDFDIIDVTFSNGEIDTVIPVAMSPIDIVHAVTPPVYTTTDDTKKDWLKIILGIILLVLLLVFLQITGILPFIISAIVWIVTAPFKAIAALFRSIKKAIKKNKDGT